MSKALLISAAFAGSAVTVSQGAAAAPLALAEPLMVATNGGLFEQIYLYKCRHYPTVITAGITPTVFIDMDIGIIIDPLSLRAH